MKKPGYRPRRAGGECEVEELSEMLTAVKCWYSRTRRRGIEDGTRAAGGCELVKIEEVEVEVRMDKELDGDQGKEF